MIGASAAELELRVEERRRALLEARADHQQFRQTVSDKVRYLTEFIQFLAIFQLFCWQIQSKLRKTFY